MQNLNKHIKTKPKLKTNIQL